MDRQQTILSDSSQNQTWKIFVDGASRGNPGPAGAGIVITKNDRLIEKHGYFLEKKTNNQAEYFALLFGIFLITEHFCIEKNIIFFSDSELLVRQINGLYRVKNQLLLPLFNRAQEAMAQIDYKIKHIPRSENSYADAMANKGIDSKQFPPGVFLAWVKKERS